MHIEYAIVKCINGILYTLTTDFWYVAVALWHETYVCVFFIGLDALNSYALPFFSRLMFYSASTKIKSHDQKQKQPLNVAKIK